jgi:hypothetical protein
MLPEKGSKHLKDWLQDWQWSKWKKPRKKKTLTLSWEGPYQFVEHVDGNGNVDFEEGSMLCIIRDGDVH